MQTMSSSTPLLTAPFDHSERHSDIVIVIDSAKFHFNSLVLQTYCPDLLEFCKRNGFVPSDSVTELTTNKQSACVAVGKWIFKVTDEKIRSSQMFELQRDIYQIESLDPMIERDTGDLAYLFRYFGLSTYQHKYYSINRISLESVFNADSPYYPDRLHIFLARTQMSKDKWEKIVWEMSPADLLIVLQSDKLYVPSEYTEEIMAQKLSTYSAQNAAVVSSDVKRDLLMCLNVSFLPAKFIAEELGKICGDPTVLFELLQPRPVKSRGTLQSPYVVSEKSDLNKPGMHLVTLTHFKEHGDEIKKTLLGPSIQSVDEKNGNFSRNILIGDHKDRYYLKVNNIDVRTFRLIAPGQECRFSDRYNENGNLHYVSTPGTGFFLYYID